MGIYLDTIIWCKFIPKKNYLPFSKLEKTKEKFVICAINHHFKVHISECSIYVHLWVNLFFLKKPLIVCSISM